MENVALPLPRQAPVRAEAVVPTAHRRQALALLTLLRPHHWLKNLLVIPLPLLESRIWTAAGLARTALMVVAFMLASSVIYVVNDVSDRVRDSGHPTKRLRPIASGQVSVATAYGLVAVLVGVLLTIVAVLPPSLTWPLLAYLPLNLAYSFRLKHVPLVDAFTVAVGFVLRVLQGYLALDRPPSGWLVLSVFWACLLLSLLRRRHELGHLGAQHRPALSGYSVAFIDQIATLSAGLTAATALLYLATDAPIEQYRSAGMVLLGPVTVFALFRYLQLVSVGDGGGSAVRTLLRDAPMVVCGAAWAVTLLALVLASG